MMFIQMQFHHSGKIQLSAADAAFAGAVDAAQLMANSAKKAGIEMGDYITEFKIENSNRPNKKLVYPIALFLLLVFGYLNKRRTSQPPNPALGRGFFNIFHIPEAVAISLPLHSK